MNQNLVKNMKNSFVVVLTPFVVIGLITGTSLVWASSEKKYKLKVVDSSSDTTTYEENVITTYGSNNSNPNGGGNNGNDGGNNGNGGRPK